MSNWEQREFASFALIYIKMEASAGNNDVVELACMDDDNGVIVVDPLLSFGAFEGPCKFNGKASMRSCGFITHDSRVSFFNRGRQVPHQ